MNRGSEGVEVGEFTNKAIRARLVVEHCTKSIETDDNAWIGFHC